jgi:hypothetical protein
VYNKITNKNSEFVRYMASMLTSMSFRNLGQSQDNLTEIPSYHINPIG